jgi:hypothetical protein
LKKIITFFILFIFSCNCSFAEVVFYEDFSFYGELLTDIDLNKECTEKDIQIIFPSYLNKKIPFILNGKAKLKKINSNSMIYLEFNELSTNAKRYIPVEILVTGVNGKKLNQACYPNKNSYNAGFNNAKAYAKEFTFFPINRYKSIPKVAKLSGNNFIMLLEPFYAFGGLALYAFSPINALFYYRNNFCDIPRGSIIEFEFSEQLTREELNKIIDVEYF